MTPEQKIITIAEFEGWRIAERVHPEAKAHSFMCWIRPGGEEWQEEAVPPYLTSRDAVCGAVAKLDAHQGAEFVSHLAKVQGWTYQHESTFSDSIFSLITATPAQLADALLLTLGKEI